MNSSIQGIIDHMFRDTADNAETRALHEELLNNCLEHYDDLIARGMSETEAIDAVVDSLKGMKEVIDEYPKEPGRENAQPETRKQDIPEIRADAPEKEIPPEEKPSEYTYDAAAVRRTARTRFRQPPRQSWGLTPTTISKRRSSRARRSSGSASCGCMRAPT